MRRIFCLLIALTLCFLWDASVVVAQTQRPSGTSVILLDNGHVLEGQLIDEGEQVLIRLGPGSQMRLPRGRVRGVGADRRALFHLQDRQLHANDVSGRVELARWCLRNDLTDDAGRLLLDLKRMAPRDSQVAYLERQIRQLHTQPVAPVEPKEQATLPPSKNEDTQETTAKVKPEQLAVFASHVQPVLLNHCSASGCHGVAAKSEFKLLRPFTGHGLTQRMTTANLQAAMQFVDPGRPLESPLYLAASVPHGNHSTPILGGPRDQASLQVLKEWLSSFGTAKPQTAAKDVVEKFEPTGHDATAVENTQSTDIAGSEPSHPLQNWGANLHQVPPQANAANQQSHVEPTDPYDAETFNRQFFPERFEPPDPFAQSPEEPRPSTLNSPASIAPKNARLLESNPESLRNSSGERQ